MVQKYNEIEVKNNMKVEMSGNDAEPMEAVAPVEKKLEKIVAVQPKRVKRGLMSRLISGVLGPDGLPSIGTYVNEEIIKPAVKNLIFDAITSAASKAMFGDKGGPYRGGSRPTGASYRPATNYSNRYGSPNTQRPEPEERKPIRPARYGVDDYLIVDRYDASHVLISLQENAERYNVTSVADYYELIGVPSQHTDNNYGWTVDSISRASIVPVQGGFVIKFPPVEVI
jgi:hypothetical protein